MQNEPEIYMYPKNKHYEKIIGGYRSLNLRCTKSIINEVFVGTVSKRCWQWSCYVTMTCDEITKIILVLHRRRHGTDVGR